MPSRRHTIGDKPDEPTKPLPPTVILEHMRESFSGRDVAMIAGGIALGMVGFRILPPLLAMGTGRIRARAGGDPFEKLKEDHRLILTTLHEMEDLDAGSFGKRSAKFLILKRKLAKHALAEEDVVYPLLNDDAQRQEAAKHLYEEHADMKVLMFRIETALMQDEPWTDSVRELRQMIERHAREEEEEQFPKLLQALNEQKARQLSAQVRREEALIL